MKPSILSSIALSAIVALAAACPANADQLFTGATLDDINVCLNSKVYPYNEMRACERALDDLSAQSETTTNQVDLQNVSLMMANVGVVDGYLYTQLGMDGAEGMFSSARSLLQTVRNHAVSSEIAQHADEMIAVMDKDGI